MNTTTTSALASALALTLMAHAPSAAADNTLLDEGFEDVSSLASKGWVIDNRSSPLGNVSEGYFQGQPYLFEAQSGPINSYVASDFNAGTQGGSIADWLITPTFSTKYDGSVSFWVRSDPIVEYRDYFSYGLSGGGVSTAEFSLTRAQLVPYQWTQYTMSFTGTGQDTFGRLAIVHVGLADTSNHIGVDSVMVTAVPEPAPLVLLATGLLSLSLLRRRAAR